MVEDIAGRCSACGHRQSIEHLSLVIVGRRVTIVCYRCVAVAAERIDAELAVGDG